MYVEETGGESAHVDANRNSLRSVENTGATTVDATCNWWGQASGPGAGQVTGPVTSSPFLTSTNLDGCVPRFAAASAAADGSGSAGQGDVAASQSGCDGALVGSDEQRWLADQRLSGHAADQRCRSAGSHV